eukprot:6960247-Prymnesium_polylepis.1
MSRQVGTGHPSCSQRARRSQDIASTSCTTEWTMPWKSCRCARQLDDQCGNNELFVERTPVIHTHVWRRRRTPAAISENAGTLPKRVDYSRAWDGHRMLEERCARAVASRTHRDTPAAQVH